MSATCCTERACSTLLGTETMVLVGALGLTQAGDLLPLQQDAWAVLTLKMSCRSSKRPGLNLAPR